MNRDRSPRECLEDQGGYHDDRLLSSFLFIPQIYQVNAREEIPIRMVLPRLALYSRWSLAVKARFELVRL